MCGNSASDWNTKATRRSWMGRFFFACASNQTSSPSAMRPASGRKRPAIEARIVLLPEPDGPNRTVMPGGASKATSRRKLPPAGRRRISTVRVSLAIGALRELGDEVEHHAREDGEEADHEQ